MVKFDTLQSGLLGDWLAGLIKLIIQQYQSLAKVGVRAVYYISWNYSCRFLAFRFESIAQFYCLKLSSICSLISPFWTIFEVGIRLKYFFETYTYRLSTLVLEVQPYIFVSNLAPLGAFWALFGSCNAVFGIPIRFKNFFGICFHRLITLI